MGALWGGLMGKIFSIRPMLGKMPYAVLWEVLCVLLWRRLMGMSYGESYAEGSCENSYGELVLGSALLKLGDPTPKSYGRSYAVPYGSVMRAPRGLPP